MWGMMAPGREPCVLQFVAAAGWVQGAAAGCSAVGFNRLHKRLQEAGGGGR